MSLRIVEESIHQGYRKLGGDFKGSVDTLNLPGKTLRVGS
jgi:hypothetical protein